MSLFTGIRSGLRSGLRSGINPGDSAGMASVARDAGSGVYLPATAAQWTATLAAAGIASGGPSALHLLNDVAGNPVDAIGTFPLTASGTLTYGAGASGWTKVGIATTLGVAGLLQTTAAGLPDISTTSLLALVYAATPATIATTRSLFQVGPTFGSQAAALFITSTNKKLRAVADPNTADGTDDPSVAVHPFILKVDRTNAVCRLYSDREKLSPTLTATPTGKGYALGGDNTMSFFPDTFVFLYSALFFGGSAEMGDASVHALLQTLGWSLAW